MLSLSEKLNESLEILQRLQEQGKVAIRSDELSRVHRERLVKSGFLKEVMKGWYVSAHPSEPDKESKDLQETFWAFCAVYFRDRFGSNWCLSPEQSLSLHAGNKTVPKQLIVRSNSGGNNITRFSSNVSIQDIHMPLPPRSEIIYKDGLNLYNLPLALTVCSPAFFRQNSVDAQAALNSIQNPSEILKRLIEGGHTVIAGRLAGAFRHIGKSYLADEILNKMAGAGFNCRENNPFKSIGAPITQEEPALSRYERRKAAIKSTLEKLTAASKRPHKSAMAQNPIEAVLREHLELHEDRDQLLADEQTPKSSVSLPSKTGSTSDFEQTVQMWKSILWGLIFFLIIWNAFIYFYIKTLESMK